MSKRSEGREGMETEKGRIGEGVKNNSPIRRFSDSPFRIFFLLLTAYCLLPTLFTMTAIAAESAIKLYPTPSERSLPIAISVDAKGQIWFVELNVNKIAMFQPAISAFFEYDIPTTRSIPTDIVVDANGIVWFTEQDANQIGRFDPRTKTFKEYEIPTHNSQPTRLTLDRGGNVWFTEFAENKIGRLDVKKGDTSGCGDVIFYEC